MQRVIDNDLAAAELLREIIEDEKAIEFTDIKFENWPRLTIELRGENYRGSITTNEMVELQKYQLELNRAFAFVVHGQSNPRLLSDDEVNALLLSFKVSEGSAIIEALAAVFVGKMGEGGKLNMSGTQLTFVIVALSAMFFTASSYTQHLEHQTRKYEQEMMLEKEREILSNQRFTSVQHLETIKIIKSLVDQDHRLEGIKQSSDIAHQRLIRLQRNADTSSVNGIELEAEIAQILAKTRRRTSKLARLDGYYVMRAHKMKPSGTLLLTFENVETGQTIKPVLPEDGLTIAAREAISRTFMSGKQVYLQIEARVVDREIRAPKIISAFSEKPKE